MAGWHHDNANWKAKSCPVCGAEFIPKSGSHKFCSAPCKGKWKYISGSMTTESQYALISGNWSRYVARLLYYGGRKRDKLTREAILRVLEKQDYKCALTGVPLTCTLKLGQVSRTNASIDRIVAGGPYTEENIQIVCRAVNSWRGNLPVGEFVEWCARVAEHNKAMLLATEAAKEVDDHG